jgi:RNA polymerase sigma factor (sigma-70 family)
MHLKWSSIKQKGVILLAVRNLDEMHLTSRDSLILDNMNLVKYFAQKYRRYAAIKGFDFDDLVSVGSIGLIKAIDSYDPTKGCEFKVYYLCKIHTEISDYLKGKANRIRVSEKIGRVQKLIINNGLRHEAPEVIAREINRDVRMVIKALRAITFNDSLSLDMLGTKPGERDIEKKDYQKFPFVEEDLTVIYVNEFKATLTSREINIIDLSIKSMSMREIGNELGISRPVVWRVIDGIREKWKNYSLPSRPRSEG